MRILQTLVIDFVEVIYYFYAHVDLLSGGGFIFRNLILGSVLVGLGCLEVFREKNKKPSIFQNYFLINNLVKN